MNTQCIHSLGTISREQPEYWNNNESVPPTHSRCHSEAVDLHWWWNLHSNATGAVQCPRRHCKWHIQLYPKSLL